MQICLKHLESQPQSKFNTFLYSVKCKLDRVGAE